MAFTIGELKENFTSGHVVAICVRPERLQPVVGLKKVLAIVDVGLAGDRYRNKGGARQVTLIQAEHLKTISSFLNKEISLSMVRRNIAVQGINLLSLKGKQFRIGTAILECSGECHPCSRMESSLGAGGYNAMRGLGGITARVVETGEIEVGSKVSVFS